MIEVTIRTEDEVTLQRLLKFIKEIGLEVTSPTVELVKKNIQPTLKEITPSSKKTPKIEWAKNPEKAQEFFGIWKDKPRTQNQLRNASWKGHL